MYWFPLYMDPKRGLRGETSTALGRGHVRTPVHLAQLAASSYGFGGVRLQWQIY